MVFGIKGVFGEHVWTNVNIDGQWKDIDTTSSMNTFDKIKNWTRAKNIKILTSVNF